MKKNVENFTQNQIKKNIYSNVKNVKRELLYYRYYQSLFFKMSSSIFLYNFFVKF